MRFLPLALLFGCVTADECEERAIAAADLAREHLIDCTFDPDALAEPSCAAENRPELTYLAVWCGEADLACILDAPARESVCFGEP